MACKHDPETAPNDDTALPKATLHLSGDDPYAIDCMMQYFYHLCYTLPSSAFTEADGAATGVVNSNHLANRVLVLHAQVYAIAEKYKVQGLKTLAMANFNSAARTRWDTDDFLEAAYEVFESTKDSDRGLRDIVVSVFRTHKDQLLHKKQVEHLLVDLRGLAVELLKDSARPPEVPVQQQNEYCQLPDHLGYEYGPHRTRRGKRKARGPYAYTMNGETGLTLIDHSPHGRQA